MNQDDSNFIINFTKARREKNKQFISDIIQSHQIQIDDTKEQKNELYNVSQTSSQMTDQLIALINQRSKEKLGPQTSQSSPRDNQLSFQPSYQYSSSEAILNQYGSDKMFNSTSDQEQIQSTGEAVITEIDNIIEKIKKKYQFQYPISTIQNYIKEENEISQIEYDQLEDKTDEILKSIKQKIKDNTSNLLNSQVSDQSIQQTSEISPKILIQENLKLKISPQQNIKQEQPPQKFKYEQPSTEIKATIGKEEQNKNVDFKNNIKKLKQAYKSEPPPKYQASTKAEKQKVLNEVEIKERQTEEKNQQFEADQFDSNDQKDQVPFTFQTPQKQLNFETQSNLTYSQSMMNSDINRQSIKDIKHLMQNQKSSGKELPEYRQHKNDQILQSLIEEEIQLYQRLQELRIQLQKTYE